MAAVLRGDWLTTGPLVERFEAELAKSAGVREAVVVNSGTAALHVAYYAAGLGPGSELVTSPLTFASTASCALHLGASVRFADVDAKTGNLDPDAAQGAVCRATRVITSVDFAGHPADDERLSAVARGCSAFHVSDAAH